MAHSQYAGHIWRRYDNGIAWFGRVWIGLEAFLFQPDTIPFPLYQLRFVGGRNLGAHGKPNLMLPSPRRNELFLARKSHKPKRLLDFRTIEPLMSVGCCSRRERRPISERIRGRIERDQNAPRRGWRGAASCSLPRLSGVVVLLAPSIEGVG
jgi:hypothetical protein